MGVLSEREAELHRRYLNDPGFHARVEVVAATIRREMHVGWSRALIVALQAVSELDEHAPRRVEVVSDGRTLGYYQDGDTIHLCNLPGAADATRFDVEVKNNVDGSQQTIRPRSATR